MYCAICGCSIAYDEEYENDDYLDRPCHLYCLAAEAEHREYDSERD